jgi:hypothetical protein
MQLVATLVVLRKVLQSSSQPSPHGNVETAVGVAVQCVLVPGNLIIRVILHDGFGQADAATLGHLVGCANLVNV